MMRLALIKSNYFFSFPTRSSSRKWEKWEIVLIASSFDDNEKFATIYRIKDLSEGIVSHWYSPWKMLEIL